MIQVVLWSLAAVFLGIAGYAVYKLGQLNGWAEGYEDGRRTISQQWPDDATTLVTRGRGDN